jgi:antitoxin ChpS
MVNKGFMKPPDGFSLIHLRSQQQSELMKIVGLSIRHGHYCKITRLSHVSIWSRFSIDPTWSRFYNVDTFGGEIMELPIQKWGNSAAVRLPATLLTQLGVTLGDKLSAKMQQDALVLRPARKSYELADLIAQCDLNAAPPADLAAWGELKPVGHEVW